MKIFSILIFLLFSLNSHSRLSLTTSGGVSLGVYEAGFLYYSMYQESKLENRRDGNIIVTGASAGAINSFITILERCSEITENPRDSLFWKSWIPLNFDKFFITKTSNVNSLLQRKSISNIFNSLKVQWSKGLKKDCVSTLGMTITREKPYELKESSKLKYTRVQEHLILKVTGNGPGLEPSVVNIYLKGRGSQMFLPLNLPEYNNFSLIQNALLASSSFPIAFEPMAMPYCMIHNSEIKKCKSEDVEQDLFLDGGIFNNAPLDLAYEIAKNDGDEFKTTYVYFDPSIKDYPVRTEDDFSNIDPGIGKDFLKFIQNFITSSRGGQISNFLRNHSNVYDQLHILKSTMPLASEPLYGFFGFFEEDFRIFDFYMGMLDSKRSRTIKYSPKTSLELDKLNVNMKVIECLDAVYNNHSRTISYCSKLDLPNFKNFSALFRVSIESLFDNCSKLDKKLNVENRICKMSQSGLGPNVFDPHWDKDWRKLNDESQLTYVMRRLGKNKFKFKDLEVERKGSDIALVKVKEKITKAVMFSANGQPNDHRLLMNQLASPFMNYLFYSPKQINKYFLLGNNSLDIGTSSVLSSSDISSLYWRYGFGLMLTGFDIIYRPEIKHVGLVPYFGIYGEPTSFSTPLLQYRFGVRLGYQFSTKNSFKLGSCNIDSRATSEFSKCSSFLVSGVFKLSIFETIASELSLSVLPINRNGSKRPVYFSFMAGLEF